MNAAAEKLAQHMREIAPRPQNWYHNRRLRKCCFDRHETLVAVRSLPSGAQGDAEVVRREATKELLVRKFVPHYKVDYYRKEDEIPEEVKILRDFLPEHKNVVELLDYSVGLDQVTLFFPYYYGGDLFRLIYKYSVAMKKVPELMIWQAFRQISEALAYLHHGYSASSGRVRSDWRQVVHRDLKTDNIFIRSPIHPGVGSQDPIFVLADFGLATTDIGNEDAIGTPEFWPPEGPGATTAADMYGLGAVVHAMAHENLAPIATQPSNCLDSRQEWARRPGSQAPRSLASKYSKQLELFMMKCFEPNPEKRIQSLTLLHQIENELRPNSRVGQ
ncbi:MAG: hypothetical protein Q9195_005429 [Heterodermia aff. obscurata]